MANPMMTEAHFQLIADAICDLRFDASLNPAPLRAAVANKFAAVLGQTNANFNRSRFLSACGVGD
jgi:hypothetical protein